MGEPQWMTTIHCGDGKQPIRWLADVAIYKYDQNYNFCCGTPLALKFENGVDTVMNSHINTELKDDLHLYLYFKEDHMQQSDKASARGNQKKGKK